MALEAQAATFATETRLPEDIHEVMVRFYPTCRRLLALGKFAEKIPTTKKRLLAAVAPTVHILIMRQWGMMGLSAVP